MHVCVCVGGWECVCVVGSMQSCPLSSSESDRQDRVGDKVADHACQKNSRKKKPRRRQTFSILTTSVNFKLNWFSIVVFVLFFFRANFLKIWSLCFLPSCLSIYFPFASLLKCVLLYFSRPDTGLNIQASPFIHWYFIHAVLCSCPDVSPWLDWCMCAVSDYLFCSYTETWPIADPIYGSY